MEALVYTFLLVGTLGIIFFCNFFDISISKRVQGAVQPFRTKNFCLPDQRCSKWTNFIWILGFLGALSATVMFA